MKKYVVGIILDKEYSKVLLIRKNRPFWQEGFLNGVGGHVEEGETSYEAMCRECLEECGLELYNWLLLGTVTDNKHYTVDFFSIQVEHFYNARSTTDEDIERIPVNGLNYDQIVPPTDMFIRLALNPRFSAFKLSER